MENSIIDLGKERTAREYSKRRLCCKTCEFSNNEKFCAVCSRAFCEGFVKGIKHEKKLRRIAC